ncbi:MAG: hypothetical protein GX815_07810 [Clostridiales bacterium]|nr:hypothetical protein [Clostridiales bacterium]
MKIIAHRSGPGKYPEQTIEAATHSLELGADFVEMDIRFTSDGIPVICHDPNALRIFGMDSDIDKLTLTEFLSLRHVSDKGYSSHALSDVFNCNIAPILLHCKITGQLINDLLQYLRQYNYEYKVIIGVYQPDDVCRIKSFNPAIKTLAFMQSATDYESYIQNGVDIIRLWEQWVSVKAVDSILNTGRKVWIMANAPNLGGVGHTSEENIHLWAGMGIDGVLIDDVEWALKRGNYEK